jgi:hypothetical protein
MPDTDKIRERLSEASDYDKHMALEKVLDELEDGCLCEFRDTTDMLCSDCELILVIQNELCEEE